MSTNRKPIFFDVTLRDGNQALQKPWNTDEKKMVFQKLIELNVHGAELGFASASNTDFEACNILSRIAPESMVVSSLSRAVEREIDLSYQAIKSALKPRVHIVFPVSKMAIEKVLRIDYATAKEKALNAIRFARKIISNKTEIQFSGEHFGDSEDNLDFVIDLFSSAIKEGVNVINLPNTVERTRPFHFTSLVEKVIKELSPEAIVSVHTHNDLGMATATTVESYYVGATQLEVTLNGLGERAGNTNLYEVACALKNCGEQIDLRMEKFYETAQFVSKMTSIPISEKAPIIGKDIFSHRSGIHQDGVIKTKKGVKNIYGSFSPELVGHGSGHSIFFTSQSGSSAIVDFLNQKNIQMSQEDLNSFQLFLKRKSDEQNKSFGENEVLGFYDEYVVL
jgi:2-isopropylmalate synthase